MLCNACGLFLKLHGRPRPISLKTDVIKSRNRVKSGQGAKRKVSSVMCHLRWCRSADYSMQNMFESNGLPGGRSDAGTPPPGSIGYRRTSGKTSSGASNGSISPVSRTVTPAAPFASHPSPHAMFEVVSLPDPSTLPGFHMNRPSPGPASCLNDRHLEPPRTYEALLAANTALRTRVSELEVINDLFRERVAELESQVNAKRDGQQQESEEYLRYALHETQQREQDLKRRVSDMELEYQDLKESGTRTKKMRVSDIVDGDTPATPQSTTS